MVTTVQDPKPKEIVSESRVTQLDELAETIRDNAINLTRSQLPTFQKDQSLDVLLLRQDFIERFKCGLAKGIGDTLAAFDKQVCSLYIFEPSTNPDIESGENLSLDPTLHLLLLVKTPTAALEAFVTSLDRALTQRLKELPYPLIADCESILDIVLITKEDVERRRGYAALLTSLFAPPLKIC